MNEERFTLHGATLLCWASNINSVSISIPRQSLLTESVGAGRREKGERRERGGREEGERREGGREGERRREGGREGKGRRDKRRRREEEERREEGKDGERKREQDTREVKRCEKELTASHLTMMDRGCLDFLNPTGPQFVMNPFLSLPARCI